MKKAFNKGAWPWLVGLVCVPVTALVLALLMFLLNGLLLFPIAAWLVIYPIYRLFSYFLKQDKIREELKEK